MQCFLVFRVNIDFFIINFSCYHPVEVISDIGVIYIRLD